MSSIDPLLERPLKQTVTSPLIRRDLDQFLQRQTWHAPLDFAETVGIGFGLILVSMGLFQLVQGALYPFLVYAVVGLLVALTAAYAGRLFFAYAHIGLWEESTLQVTSAFVGEVYGEERGTDRDYLGNVSSLLALLATAPTYIGEEARYTYWCDTLDELRQHAEATRAMRSITEQRTAAQARLAAVQGEVQVPTPTKRWGILPAPPVTEDPLVRTARVQMAEIETTYRDLTAYLGRITTNVDARRRELGRAIAATELYLEVPSEALVLPSLPAVEPLPHAEAMRTLVS